MKRKNKILTPAFFTQKTLLVARRLLGAHLVREVRGKRKVALITEVEAYDGPLDKASHAHKGKTKRNAPMFGEAGYWYVYLCYGVHNMLNIVTGPSGYPAAVLIRGVRVERGKGNGRNIKGPGRVTKFFNIDKTLNTTPCSPSSGLWIEDRGVVIPLSTIKTGPRIGVSYAGKLWAGKHYRFYLPERG